MKSSVSLQPVAVLLVGGVASDAVCLHRALNGDSLARYHLTVAGTLAEGIERAAQDPFDVILVDLDLADCQDEEQYRQLQGANRRAPFVVLSQHMDEEAALRAIQHGAQEYVVKDSAGWERIPRVIRHAIERQKVLRANKSSDSRFAAAFHRSPVCQIITSIEDGKVVDVNAAFCRMMGYEPDDLIGRTTIEIELWADPEERQKAFEVFRRDGSIQNREVVFRTRAGTRINVLASVEPIEVDGEQCAISTALDISARIQAELELKESEERFATVFFTNPVAQSILAQQIGKVMEVNDACCELFGFTREDLIGIDPGSLSLWADQNEQLEVARELRESGRLRPKETTIRRKSGDIRTILFAIEPIVWQGIPCVVTSSVDITDRKEAEERLRQSEADLAEAQRVSKLGNWHFDIARNSVTWSDELYRIFEVEKQAFDGLYESFLANVHPDDQSRVLDVNARVRASGEPFEIEYRIVTPNSREKYVREIGYSLRDVAGQVTGIFGIAQDITDRKRAEALIYAQRDLARGIGTFKSTDAGFRFILETILRLTGMDSGGVYLFTPDFQRLDLVYHQGLGAAFVAAASSFPADAANVQLILTGKPSYLVGDDPLLQKPVHRLEKLRSVAVIPVTYKERVIGCLNLASHSQGAIRTFARQALETLAVEIGNVVLHLQAQAALHASEERYRSLAEATDAIIVLLDSDGRFQYLNEKAAHTSDIQMVDALGKTLHELFPQEIADINLRRVRRVIETGQGMVVESPLANGRYLRTSIQPIHDEQGTAIMAMMSAIDITDLKNAQRELLELNLSLEERIKERTAQLQDLYDSAPIGYHSLDSDGRFIQVNQTELDWLGYSRDEIIGRHLSEISTPESMEVFRRTFPKFRETGVARDIEFNFIRKDGSILPGLVNATAVYDQHGAYLMSRSTVFDYTERKMAEQALRESEQQNRLLFENTPDAVALFDQVGRFVQANHAFELLSGFPVESSVGETMESLGLLSGDDSVLLASAVMSSRQDKSAFAVAEFEITCANGKTRTVGARVFDVTLGGRRHYLISMRDITVEKQAEETLRLANLEMEQALRMKDEFLANMSHELRTPLHGILAMSELLLGQIRGTLNEHQQKSVRGIEASGRHLLTLINDLLDLSKVEAGKLELNFTTMLVDDICQASLQFVREMAFKKQVEVSYTSMLPGVRLIADATRLKQMLVNLLSNAVKFTPADGAVKLDVTVEPDARLIHFAVQDTGPGIAPADQSKLFQPFAQLDAQLSRQYEGTGLGLALVKRLAEQHDGTVWLESAGIPGQGSCFTITLPYEPDLEASAVGVVARQPVSRAVAAVPGSGPMLLLVEDNEINVEVVEEFLRHAGYRIVVARTGIEAIEQANAISPDLILMDVHLPMLDGLEVTRRLRSQARFADTPIIALTASAMTGDRERCLAAGATDYLSKPLRMLELLEMVKKLTGSVRQS